MAAVLFVIGSAGFIVVTLGDMSVPTPVPLAAVPPLTRIVSAAPEATSAVPRQATGSASTLVPLSPTDAVTQAAAQALAASRGSVDVLPPPEPAPTDTPTPAPPTPTATPNTPTPTATASLTPSALPPPASVPSAVGSSGSNTNPVTPTATPTPHPSKTAAPGGGTMSYSGGTGIQGQPNVGGARHQPTQGAPASE